MLDEIFTDHFFFHAHFLKRMLKSENLRITHLKVAQSGVSKIPFGWHVVMRKGIANQSWSKTFVIVFYHSIIMLSKTSPSGQTKVRLKPT